AAVISWTIGAVAIFLLALTHAELGGMYPVAGGTARFPHYAFGGAAGASFGWFSWLQAATVAPIEVMAMIQYGQHYTFARGWMKLSGGQLAGESANPKRDIPRAVIMSVIIGAIIYVALQVVFLGALPASQIHGTWAHGAYTTMTGPFAQVASLVAVGWLATTLYIDAV